LDGCQDGNQDRNTGMRRRGFVSDQRLIECQTAIVFQWVRRRRRIGAHIVTFPASTT
jgi:hypothetical protein